MQYIKVYYKSDIKQDIFLVHSALFNPNTMVINSMYY